MLVVTSPPVPSPPPRAPGVGHGRPAPSSHPLLRQHHTGWTSWSSTASWWVRVTGALALPTAAARATPATHVVAGVASLLAVTTVQGSSTTRKSAGSRTGQWTPGAGLRVATAGVQRYSKRKPRHTRQLPTAAHGQQPRPRTHFTPITRHAFRKQKQTNSRLRVVLT